MRIGARALLWIGQADVLQQSDRLRRRLTARRIPMRADHLGHLIADAMHRAWIAFAHRGDPSHPGIPEWPSYDLDRRPTMRFDAECELLDDPERADRLAFADI